MIHLRSKFLTEKNDGLSHAIQPHLYFILLTLFYVFAEVKCT